MSKDRNTSVTIVNNETSLSKDDEDALWISTPLGGHRVLKSDVPKIMQFIFEQWFDGDAEAAGFCDGCDKLDSSEAYEHVMDNPPDPVWMNCLMEKWMIE